MKREEEQVTVVSDKGQVVIPQKIRKKLGIKRRTRLIVYGYQDAVIMKKLEVPDIRKELQAVYQRVAEKVAKYGELSDEEINKIIQRHRKNGRAKVAG